MTKGFALIASKTVPYFVLKEIIDTIYELNNFRIALNSPKI